MLLVAVALTLLLYGTSSSIANRQEALWSGLRTLNLLDVGILIGAAVGLYLMKKWGLYLLVFERILSLIINYMTSVAMPVTDEQLAQLAESGGLFGLSPTLYGIFMSLTFSAVVLVAVAIHFGKLK